MNPDLAYELAKERGHDMHYWHRPSGTWQQMAVCRRCGQNLVRLNDELIVASAANVDCHVSSQWEYCTKPC